MSNNVNISNTTPNSVEVSVDNNVITIIESQGNNQIVVGQTSTNVIEVRTPGPQGQKGDVGDSIDTGSFITTGSFNTFTSSYNTGSFSGSFIGQFNGSGANLSNIPANAIIGLNLSQITSGSYSASISDGGLVINNRVIASAFTGSLYGTASWAKNYNETDPIFTSVSGTFTTTASFNTFTQSYNNDSSSFDIRILDNSSSILSLSESFSLFSGSYNTGSFIGEFSGSFSGSGTNLFDIPASAIIGLNLSQITSGSYSASISDSGLLVNNTIVAPSFSGSLYGTSSWAENSISSSYSITASYAQSSSYALSASFYIETDPIFTAKSESLATTGSNIFTSGQIISGSLIVRENFTVLGSSSITYISESTLNIGTNLITVNTIDPGARFGGLAVIDSGSSPLVSASFLYDSVQDEFVFVHKGDGTNITSSHFLLGPETFNNLGNENYLTANRIPKGSGIEHLNDSNITDTGNIVSINSNTQITGSLIVTLGMSGSFSGSGANLFDIPATAIVGLNLSQISSGSYSASISENGLLINNTVIAPSFSGSLYGTASLAINAITASITTDAARANTNFQQLFLLMGG